MLSSRLMSNIISVYILILIVLTLLFCKFTVAIQFHDYCVIGAGPGGLQMGYFLAKQARNYVIFERSNVPGSFFLKYPRHRKLISINKRRTGRVNREFNMRHDWNSLLSDDGELVFTKYSNDYFPHADDLVRYYADYASKLNLNIQYNTTIASILPGNGLSGELQERCKFIMKDPDGLEYCCKYPIIATGIPVPNRMSLLEGADLVEYYDQVAIEGAEFDGQNVLVIGRGNSGMEFISGIYGYTNFVHSVARTRVRLSWDTHYVGDIRGVNNELLDSYMLKSLDGVLDVKNENFAFKRRWNGKIDIVETAGKVNPGNEDLLDLMPNSPVREGYDRIIGCLGFRWDDSILKWTHPNASGVPAASSKTNRKFPVISDNYESTQMDGLFFAGTMTHSLDWRKSAGGFIHGFRYTVRGLHRILEWLNHQNKWPCKRGSTLDLTSRVLQRANEASGLYQMFSVYCDVVIVNIKLSTFTYLEEVPYRLLPSLSETTGHQFNPDEHLLITLSLEYGVGFSKAGDDHFRIGRATSNPEMAHKCNFLHPVIRVFKNVPAQRDLSNVAWDDLYKRDISGWHHVVEDFTTSFDTQAAHVAPLRRFLEFHLGRELKPQSGEACMIRSLLRKSINERDLPIGCDKFFE